VLYANVVDGVHRVEDAYTNWYLLEQDGRLTIVDTGVPSSWDSLAHVLPQIGRTTGDVEAVVLTHGHFDDLGFAERARRELGVPVYVHDADVELTRRPLSYQHERPRFYYFATQWRALPIVASLLRHRAFWPDPVRDVVTYRDGTLPVPGAPLIVPTPGHTNGHCALHLPDRDAVIAGDAIVTLDPYTGRTGPRAVARAATADSRRALAGLDGLARTGARTVLVGHGDPWTGGAEDAVARARQAGVA
jgi:glyoxylase-like metal-dependent hydrolase (beta-lactamase superfamily II)